MLLMHDKSVVADTYLTLRIVGFVVFCNLCRTIGWYAKSKEKTEILFVTSDGKNIQTTHTYLKIIKVNALKSCEVTI